jgi:hypothetical protein
MGMVVSKADSYKDAFGFPSTVETPDLTLNDTFNTSLAGESILKSV